MRFIKYQKQFAQNLIAFDNGHYKLRNIYYLKILLNVYSI